MFTFKSTLVAATLLVVPVVTPAATIPVVTGLNAITIPFLPSLNYSAYNVFSTAQDGEIIYTWNNVVGAWSYYTCDFGIWDPVAPVFIAGQGIFYYAVGPQTFVANFHGNATGAGSAPANPAVYRTMNDALVENRYYFQGSPTGESASYEDIFGGAPPGETTLYRFIPGSLQINPGSSAYDRYLYKAGVWSPQTPLMNPLEPVFVIYPTLRINVTRTGNTITLTWPARGSLESAAFPTGPWYPTATINGTNGLTVTTSPQDPPRYYRVAE